MRRAWLTPDDAPGDPVCVQIAIPGGDAYAAILRGALALLFSPDNYEPFGSQTPQAVADAFLDALYDLEVPCAAMANPVGQLFAWAGASAPDGSLACDGAEISQTDYPELYAIIGNAWGSAGAGNFLLPDLRSRMLVGTGPGNGLSAYALADVGGAERVTLNIGNMPSHRHTISHQHNIPDVGHTPVASGAIVSAYYQSLGATIPSGASTQVNSGYVGDDYSHENLPPFAAILWCVWATP